MLRDNVEPGLCAILQVLLVQSSWLMLQEFQVELARLEPTAQSPLESPVSSDEFHDTCELANHDDCSPMMSRGKQSKQFQLSESM